MFTITRPTLSKTVNFFFSKFSPKKYLQSNSKTDNWAPKMRKVQKRLSVVILPLSFINPISIKSVLVKHNESQNVHLKKNKINFQPADPFFSRHVTVTTPIFFPNKIIPCRAVWHLFGQKSRIQAFLTVLGVMVSRII